MFEPGQKNDGHPAAAWRPPGGLWADRQMAATRRPLDGHLAASGRSLGVHVAANWRPLGGHMVATPNPITWVKYTLKLKKTVTIVLEYT